MTDLYNNVLTFRLTRDTSIDNVNTTDNAWLKIIKNKNELAKVELMNRSLIDTTKKVIHEIGFPRFQINNTNWVDKSTASASNIEDISGNDNIIILDFEVLGSRNFLNDESDGDARLPILKYLIVRLTDSVENPSNTIGLNQYYNYIFSGDIIGPKEFLDFNTNYCIQYSEILEKDFNGNKIKLYYPLNWCSIINDDINDEINSYLDLNLNVQISPKYYDDGSFVSNIITHTESIIKTSYTPTVTTPPTSFYDNGIYELNNLFWCSLNSERHSKVLLFSTGDNVIDIIENQTAVDPTSIPSYTGTAYGIIQQKPIKYAYRHIPNFVYDDIKVTYNGTEKTHIGNKGGGYRKTPGTLELVRETTEPYYFDNSSIFYSSTSTDIWSMRDALEANYFEIRYKPLVPIKPLTPGTGDGNLSITFKFGYNNPDLPNPTVTTFERYPDMDGTPSTPGTTYNDAKRESESITLEWKSDDPTREQKIILFDVASGYFNQVSIINANTNYNDIQSTTFDIKTYVYQFRLEDPTTQNSLKLYNSAIKNFTETNTNIMVINNNKFNLFLFPEINITNFTNNIFNYDEENENIGIIQYDPLITEIKGNTFSVEMKLEKFFMNAGFPFDNANNLLGNAINTELLQSKKIYISGRDTTLPTTSVYSSSDGTYDQNDPSIDIRFDTTVSDNLTISRSCVSLGKGLSSLNTEYAFINENSFLFKLKQNFLSDYWKINTTLSELVTDNIIDDSFDDLERQRKIAGTILVIDLYLSGQIFLINTAKNKSDVSYIPTIVSDIEPSITGNPTLNFDFVENIPSLNTNPVYLKLSNNNNTSANIINITNTFYNGSTNNIYPGTLSNTITGTTTIDQPLNTTTTNQPLNTTTKNTFHVNTVFSNTGPVDKTPSTNTTPTPYNGIYYFDIQSSDYTLSNPTLKNMIIYPGTIQVNLVELPDIIYDPDETKLSPDNKSIIISWPRYYFDNSQGKIIWTIVRQDMATLVNITRTYDRDSTEINIIGDNIQFIDTEIRIYDKYQYTVSGEFVYNSSINVDTIQKNFSLSLSITGFTTITIFVCSGYTNRFPFGRFNTTSTNFKLFAPKLLRTDINETTRNLFASQLLLTNPVPNGYAGTEKDWLNQMDRWPGGRGSCGDNVIINGQNTQVNENIYANTSDQLSKKQIYNFLSKSRFRPDR